MFLYFFFVETRDEYIDEDCIKIHLCLNILSIMIIMLPIYVYCIHKVGIYTILTLIMSIMNFDIFIRTKTNLLTNK